MWVVWMVGEGGVGAHHPTWGFLFLIFFIASREFCRYLDFYTHRGCCTQTWRDGCGEARTHSLPSTQEAPECENNIRFAIYPNDGPACCEGGPSKCDNSFLQMMIWIIKMVRSVAKKKFLYDNCLHLIRIIWIVKLVAKSMIQYCILFAKYLDYFNSLVPSKRNVHYYKFSFTQYGSYE